MSTRKKQSVNITGIPAAFIFLFGLPLLICAFVGWMAVAFLYLVVRLWPVTLGFVIIILVIKLLI